MAWLKLDSKDILHIVLKESHHSSKIIFKHSTRCSISSMAMNRLLDASKKLDIYIIDVIKNRDISNTVEQILSVRHQSPQLLVVEGGLCKYHTSHMQISSSAIDKFISRQE